MKLHLLRLLCLICAAIPMAASSQSNIMSAFEEIIKCKDATITEKHYLERDPSTGEKIGQSDIWFFSLPANKFKLVKNVTAAFDRDKDKAYAITSGSTMGSEQIPLALAVGNDDSQSVEVTSPGHEYIYSLFLAPKSEDASGIHRYAYAMNYIQADGKIQGKLVVTYATTLKHRQEQTRNNQMRVIQGWSGNFNPIKTDVTESWLSTLMSYLQSMRRSSNNTRIALATKAYDHIQKTSKDSSVTELDKNTAREILKGMIADKEYSNPMLKQMLNACLVGLN